MQRAQRIARNNIVLEQLALKQLAQSCAAKLQPVKHSFKPRKAPGAKKKSLNNEVPARRSGRQRGHNSEGRVTAVSSSEQDSTPLMGKTLLT